MGGFRVILCRAFASAISLGVIAAAFVPRAAAAEEIVVFAAASLKNALDEISGSWTANSGNKVTISFAGSSSLAKQIQQGAPADIFISANVKWMDVLQQDDRIDVTSRRVLLGNRIVLVAHGKNAPLVDIKNGFDLAGLLKDGKLAMAMVDSVPAGIYGKAALTSLGVWDNVAGQVAQSDNVRTALALVARGEAPYGIVYATDAAASDNVSVVGTFPERSHPPIVYPVAVVADSKKKATASGFLNYLTSSEAKQVFEREGFTVIEPAVAN